jgi:hypothetical protein
MDQGVSVLAGPPPQRSTAEDRSSWGAEPSPPEVTMTWNLVFLCGVAIAILVGILT